MENDQHQRPKSMNNTQCRLVLSMVNDVYQGKKKAANFIIDEQGNLVEAGTRKEIRREKPDIDKK